jgi:hypothetical protein
MRKLSNAPPVGGFTLNRDSPLAKGLVFWLPLIDRGQTDRARGLVTTSSFSTTAPVLATTNEGLGWRIDNTSSNYLTCATPVAALPLTIACWFYPLAVASTRDLVSIGNSGNNLDFYELQQASGGGVRARQGDSTSTSSATTAGAVTANVWQLATAVYAATNLRIAYLNGTGRTTSTGTRATSTLDRIGIGAYLGGTISSWFDGYIRNVCIWNRALSDAEVWRLYDPLTRWELFAPAAWTSQSVNVPATTTTQSSKNVRPTVRGGVPIQYLRI